MYSPSGPADAQGAGEPAMSPGGADIHHGFPLYGIALGHNTNTEQIINLDLVNKALAQKPQLPPLPHDPQCSTAAAALKSVLPSCDEIKCALSGLDDSSNDLVTAVGGFDQQCMISPYQNGSIAASVPQPLASNSALDAFVLIEEQLPDGQWQPVCGGAIVKGAGIITARHCLEQGVALKIVSPNHVYNFNMIAPRNIGPRVNVADDMIAIGGPADVPPWAPDVMVEAPALSDDLYLQGYFVLARLEAGAAADAPADLIRASKDHSCKVLYTAPGCFVQSCQSINGFSGAPLFDLTASQRLGKPVIAGLVSGSPGEGHFCGNSKINANLSWSPTS